MGVAGEAGLEPAAPTGARPRPPGPRVPALGLGWRAAAADCLNREEVA